MTNNKHGALAQLGERVVRNHEVSGSIPLCSTKYIIHRIAVNCVFDRSIEGARR